MFTVWSEIQGSSYLCSVYLLSNPGGCPYRGRCWCFSTCWQPLTELGFKYSWSSFSLKYYLVVYLHWGLLMTVRGHTWFACLRLVRLVSVLGKLWVDLPFCMPCQNRDHLHPQSLMSRGTPKPRMIFSKTSFSAPWFSPLLILCAWCLHPFQEWHGFHRYPILQLEPSSACCASACTNFWSKSPLSHWCPSRRGLCCSCWTESCSVWLLHGFPTALDVSLWCASLHEVSLHRGSWDGAWIFR